MSVITVEIPESVRAVLDVAVFREHKSAEQIAGESLARLFQAKQELDYLLERAKRGRREDFETFLAKVPDASPTPGDEL